MSTRTVLAALLLLPLAFAPAWAGSPHFVSCEVEVNGATLTVSGKEAGLGDEDQVHIVLTADAACINRGNNHPQAANKETVMAEGDFPVQNGRALFDLSATATFQPSCSPPMSVEFSNISVVDETHGISCTFD